MSIYPGAGVPDSLLIPLNPVRIIEIYKKNDNFGFPVFNGMFFLRLLAGKTFLLKE